MKKKKIEYFGMFKIIDHQKVPEKVLKEKKIHYFLASISIYICLLLLSCITCRHLRIFIFFTIGRDSAY